MSKNANTKKKKTADLSAHDERELKLKAQERLKRAESERSRAEAGDGFAFYGADGKKHELRPALSLSPADFETALVTIASLSDDEGNVLSPEEISGLHVLTVIRNAARLLKKSFVGTPEEYEAAVGPFGVTGKVEIFMEWAFGVDLKKS